MLIPNAELLARLNLEAGKLRWSELQRHFARGMVVKVEPGLDLLEVAACMASDDMSCFSNWMEQGLISRAADRDALAWHEREAEFWAVVAAPWVLVQEVIVMH